MRLPRVGEYWASPKGEVWRVYNIFQRMTHSYALLLRWVAGTREVTEEVELAYLGKFWTHVTEDGKPVVEPPTPVAPPTEIAVGSVVRLKSGGPLMTVVSLDTPVKDSCVCFWFTSWGNEERIDSQPIPASCLDIVPKEVPDADPTVG